MTDDREKNKDQQSRAKTETAGSTPAESHAAGPESPSEVETVTEIDPRSVAILRSVAPQTLHKDTGPVDIVDHPKLTQRGGKCLVPRVSSAEIPSIRRSSTDIKYMGDYVKILLRMGAPHFQLAHDCPFLVGIGILGEVDDIPRSTRDTSTREVFIQDIDATASAAPILAGRVWPLIDTQNAMTDPGISIGRSAVNDVVIAEYALSKLHCRFNPSDDGGKTFVVRDLQSTNGTLLNGVRLESSEPAKIQHLDVLVLGRYQFQFFSSRGFLKELIDRAQSNCH